MAIVIVQKPDSLSMSGNLKELVLQSVDPVSVVLRAAGAIVLEETFYPGNGNLIHIGLTEVVKSHLSFTLPSSDIFIQPNLSKDFTVAYGEDSYTFRCIRSGKMHLNESATQFLTGNFLTWQPTQKAVTYYSPEWLTYYAPEDCTVRLRAYWEDGTNSTISLSGQSSGTCVSYNLQYAVIAGKFAGKRPMYYDVWVENPSGTRLSYVQRYVASEKQGEDENWYLFENSLGGIDSLRAYGALKDDPEYTHNLAVFGDESEEYRIDTNRLLTRNTGMLTPEEARWLQDMFVASRKYVYTLSGLYRIVFTSSNAKTDSANPPVSYSFTYRLSDGRPYLDIQRRTDLPENLVIPIPTGDTFFLPPRLAEFPKPTLSPDLLIPVQEPHTEVWGATTTGQIHDTVLNDLIRELDGLDLNPIQGEGGINVDIIKLNDLTIPSDTNVFSALRTLKEIADATDGLLVEVNDMFLRKDIDDTAHGNILFDKKIGSSIFIDGWEGKGWEIQSTGAAILDSLRVRSDIYVGGNTGSPTFASGFTGWGWQIDTPTATGEMDNLFIRKTFTAYEIVYSQIYGLGGSQIVSDINKIARVEVMSDRYRCYMDDMDGLMLMNLRKGDGVRIQTRTGTTSIKYLFGRCIGVDSDYFDIAIPLIKGTGQPEAGDFALRWGNNEDTDRQGLIYLTTADSGAPFIDVYDGITDASTEGKLKARIGHLTGIRTQRGDQLSGYGAYLNGIYVENSTFILQNGDTIEQTFIAMNGKFESLIDGIRNDISAEGGNILVNSSFSQNTNYWTAANNVHFINVGGEYLWPDGSFYVEKDQVADIYNDNGQNVLRIRNTYILQQNAIMNIPDHTEEEEKTYSFSLFYKVLRPGSCGFGIPGTELYHEEQLSESDSYQKLSKVGKWNGKGDFELRFTGEILIYGVGLFSDEIADAIVHLQTQITQNEEEIKLRATKDYVDAETGKIYTKYDTSLSLKADKAELTSFKEEYDEFQQVVRRNYATQSWTSSKIQTEVGSYVDGALVGYATTSWTSSQISSSVKGLASKSFVDQTAEGLNINIKKLGNRVNSVEGELDSVTDITGAFYSFGSNKMRLNRRIEMGSGSNSSFACLAGMSPDITGPAFWAGSSWEDRANSAIRLGHDGAGWLAKKNVFWDIGGNLSITGKIQSSNNGNRFVIDPSERSFKMINNSNSLVTEFKFDNVSGYQSIPALHMYLRNSNSGSTIYRYSMGIAGFSVHDVNGKILSSLSTGLILTSIPIIDPKSLGMVWRDGNVLKISLG